MNDGKTAQVHEFCLDQVRMHVQLWNHTCNFEIIPATTNHICDNHFYYNELSPITMRKSSKLRSKSKCPAATKACKQTKSISSLNSAVIDMRRALWQRPDHMISLVHLDKCMLLSANWPTPPTSGHMSWTHYFWSSLWMQSIMQQWMRYHHAIWQQSIGSLFRNAKWKLCI